jgi:hypothetical protein
MEKVSDVVKTCLLDEPLPSARASLPSISSHFSLQEFISLPMHRFHLATVHGTISSCALVRTTDDGWAGCGLSCMNVCLCFRSLIGFQFCVENRFSASTISDADFSRVMMSVAARHVASGVDTLVHRMAHDAFAARIVCRSVPPRSILDGMDHL